MNKLIVTIILAILALSLNATTLVHKNSAPQKSSEVSAVINHTIAKSAPSIVQQKGDILFESFEEAVPPTGWVKYSPDGGTGWNQQTNGTIPVPGWNGTGAVTVPQGGGDKVAFATWNTGGIAANDQWLVSKAVTITKANTILSFWIRKYTTYKDNLKVLISETTQSQAAFTTTLQTYAFGTTPEVWNKKEIDLSAYVGKTVYLAFNEFVADNQTDGDAIFLDLVKVTEPTVGPDFEITPTASNFGSLSIGDSKKVIFKIKSVGTANLIIAANAITLIGANAAEFAVSDIHTMNIAPAATDSFYVTCTPTSAGAKVAQIKIVDNITKAEHLVDISCTAYAPYTAINENFDGLTAPILPAGWTINGAYTKIYGFANTATVSWSHSPLNFVAFSTDEAGMSMLVTPKLVNANCQLKIWARSSTAQGAGDGTKELKYGVISDPSNPSSFEEKGIIQVGPEYSELHAFISSYTGQAKYIAFKFEDQNFIMADDVSIYCLHPTPAFSITPTSANFGDFALNVASSTKVFTVKNNGYGIITVNTISINGTDASMFTLTNTNTMPLTLSAGQSALVSVVFKPTSLGVKTANLVINASEKTLHEVNMSGSGIDVLLMEGFETGIPSSWKVLDVDATGTTWTELAGISTLLAHSGAKMAYHQFASSSEGAQNGLLITPAIQIGSTGGRLKFWETSKFPTYYSYHGVLISTTNTDLASFTEVEQVPVVTAAWTEKTINLPYPGQTIYLAFDYKGTNADNWYIDDVLISNNTLSINDNNLPLVTTLSQNYPNPFNPTTTISFSLPKTGYAELSVFNVKGELVKTLTKGICNAGINQLKFEGNDLSSGMYYYRLVTPAGIMWKKMILCK